MSSMGVGLRELLADSLVLRRLPRRAAVAGDFHDVRALPVRGRRRCEIHRIEVLSWTPIAIAMFSATGSAPGTWTIERLNATSPGCERPFPPTLFPRRTRAGS